MAKDKVVDLVKKEDVKKALCTVQIIGGNVKYLEFKDVAGYQLLEGTLIVLIHEGPTYLFPLTSFDQVEIKANKE